VKSYKQFVAEARENSLDEGWRDYLPSADQVSAFGRNFADKATLGGYKYARAGADYVVKKAMGKKTTYKKELDQEKEKLKAGEKKYPGTTVAADLAGHIAPAIVAPEAIAMAKGAQGAADMATSMYPRVKKAIVGEGLKTFKQFIDVNKDDMLVPQSKTPEVSKIVNPENFYYDDQGKKLELIPGKIDIKKSLEKIYKDTESNTPIVNKPMKKVPYATDEFGNKSEPSRVLILKSKPKTKKSE
jgi:hypothetical protein